MEVSRSTNVPLNEQIGSVNDLLQDSKLLTKKAKKQLKKLGLEPSELLKIQTISSVPKVFSHNDQLILLDLLQQLRQRRRLSIDRPPVIVQIQSKTERSSSIEKHQRKSSSSNLLPTLMNTAERSDESNSNSSYSIASTISISNSPRTPRRNSLGRHDSAGLVVSVGLGLGNANNNNGNNNTNNGNETGNQSPRGLRSVGRTDSGAVARILLEEEQKVKESLRKRAGLEFKVERFEEKETKLCIQLDPRDQSIKLATLEKIIQRLTFDRKAAGPDFLKEFLLTYRLLISPSELFDLILLRYDTAFVESDTASLDGTERLLKIRLKIIRVLKHWIQNHFEDFTEDQLLSPLQIQQLQQQQDQQQTPQQQQQQLPQTPNNNNNNANTNTNSTERLPDSNAMMSRLMDFLENKMSDTDMESAAVQIIPLVKRQEEEWKNQASQTHTITVFNARSYLSLASHNGNNINNNNSSDNLSQSSTSSLPNPTMNKRSMIMRVLDINVDELARQLTLMEWELFSKIPLRQLYLYNTKKGQNPAPQVAVVLHHFDTMIRWMVGELLITPSVSNLRTDTFNGLISQNGNSASNSSSSLNSLGIDLTASDSVRLEKLKMFIILGNTCRNLNNFSTAVQVVSALQRTPIRKLHSLWDQLPADYWEIWQNLVQLFSKEGSFAMCRAAWSSSSKPGVPFLKLYLEDMADIDIQHPSFVDSIGGLPYDEAKFLQAKHKNDPAPLANFEKCMLVAKLLQEIEQYQTTPFKFEKSSQIRDYILRHPVLGDERNIF